MLQEEKTGRKGAAGRTCFAGLRIRRRVQGGEGERTGDSRSFLLLSYDCYDFDLARSLSDRTVASFLCDLRYK